MHLIFPFSKSIILLRNNSLSPENVTSPPIPIPHLPRRLLSPLKLRRPRLNQPLNARLHLIDSLHLSGLLLGHIHPSQIPLLLLLMQIVNLPRSRLLLLLNQLEVTLPRLLRRHNLRVVHVYLVHPIVMLRPIQLPKDVLPKLIVANKVTRLVPPYQLVHVCVHPHVVLTQHLPEVVLV